MFSYKNQYFFIKHRPVGRVSVLPSIAKKTIIQMKYLRNKKWHGKSNLYLYLKVLFFLWLKKLQTNSS